MVELAEKLERIYRIFPWPEDLSSPTVNKRLDEAYKVFKDLLDHPWLKDLLEERKNRDLIVIDICGGAGIGGIALAKALMDKGLGVKLIVNDLRITALEKARRYAKQILGIEIETLIEDALKLHEHNIRADLALIYGLTTPHFNPYQMVTLIASIAWILKPNGILLVEEHDRIYQIFYRIGYKQVLAEYAGEDRIALSIHAGYNPLTGVFKRVFLDIPSMERVLADVRFWDIAGVAATLWIFFEDVDFKPTRTQIRGILIAKKPRGINPRDYTMLPTIVKGSQQT